MKERSSKSDTQLTIDTLVFISQASSPDRSSSIDSKHTFVRGGYSDPNSGNEHNPTLEIENSLFNQRGTEALHVKPDVSSSQLVIFEAEL